VSESSVIRVDHLRREFTVTRRDPGFGPAIRSLIRPRRETVVAVDDVSFVVSRGEILGYLGPNGAGKSTTIKLLTGILVPTAGSARVNGIEPYRARTENAKRIGVVFGQRTQLWWDLPAVETFHILRDMYALDRSTFDRQIADLDAHLAITPFWTTPVRQLSLGQRMRCDLAAAMLHDPPVLFLDEPTVGMDVVVKEHVRQLLAHLASERGTTIVLTTHDLGDVERLCRRVIVLDRGRLLYDGALDRLAELHGVHRRLRVTFAQAVDGPVLEGAELVEVDGLEVTFRFPTSANPGALIAALTSRYEVADLTVESVDFEEVIRLIYETSGATR
jgi:viologen exporter family transport system ATP-binding protein